jgi:hypothetical protein
MKHLVGKAKDSLAVQFMGEEVVVEALPLAAIKLFQVYVKKVNEDKKLSDEDRILSIQRYLIRHSVVGAADMTDEDLDSFPPRRLGELSRAIMEHNGVNVDPVAESAEGNV